MEGNRVGFPAFCHVAVQIPLMNHKNILKEMAYTVYKIYY